VGKLTENIKAYLPRDEENGKD
jgi:hypothetical protein